MLRNHKNILLIGEKFVPEGNLHLALKREGHAVTTVLDGWQAMTLVDETLIGSNPKNYFHLVILGHPIKSMPEVEILTLLRSKFSKNKLPIICIVQNEAEKDLIQMMKDLEATLVIEFPRSVTLIKVIKELLTKFFP